MGKHTETVGFGGMERVEKCDPSVMMMMMMSYVFCLSWFLVWWFAFFVHKVMKQVLSGRSGIFLLL